MLIAIGPGVDAAQDYTNYIDYRSLKIHQVQGDTLDTCEFALHDPTCDFTVNCEDDVIVLDETDTNGWPTVNLVSNPGFEGGFYTSGGSSIGTGWVIGAQPSGVLFKDHTGNPMHGSHAQQLQMTNVAASSWVELNQSVALPQDEGGNPIVTAYVLSGWVRVDAAFAGTGSGPNVQIDWLDANGSVISTSSVVIPFSSTDATAWFRFSMTVTPPSTAYVAKAKLAFWVAAGSITGNCYYDSIQCELQTFKNVLIAAPNPPVRNPYMNLSSGGSYVDDWWHTAPSGATFSTATSPLLNGDHCQKITLANMGSGQQAYIYQGYAGGYEIPVNVFAAYTARLTYQITTILAGCHAWFQLGFYDSNNTFLGFASATGPDNEATSGGGSNWKQLLISFGPGSGVSIPTNTATIQLLCGLETTSGTNSGVIAIGQVDVLVTAYALQQQANSTYMTAGQAGKYPTPYCDNQQAGCYIDRSTGFYYRQFRLFAGFARTMEYDYAVEPECDIKITCVDYGVILQEAPCTLRVAQQADYLTIKAVCDYAFNQSYLEGLDYQTYVQGISTIDAMIFNWRTTRDVLSEIANHTVAAYWVDYHKYLHYAPALAISAPFGLSDQPDSITTFPMERWVYIDDSTQSETTPVVEGSTQLSAPQTVQFNGNGSTVTFTLNNGNPVTQIDSCTVGGVAKVVGLGSVNTYSQGYDALLDPNSGKLTFQTAPVSGINNVVVTFRYDAPVMVRLHWPAAEAKKHSKYYTRHLKRHHHRVTILVRRKVHKHHPQSHITSTQSAIDQANALLTQNSKPQAMSKAWVRTPPAPYASTLRAGMAIAITHALSDLVATLFQVVELTIRPLGNGGIMRELGLGAYQPDFMIHQMHVNRRTKTDSADDGSTTLNDILSNSDGWAITDNITATVANVGKWGNPTTSTWNGTSVWG